MVYDFIRENTRKTGSMILCLTLLLFFVTGCRKSEPTPTAEVTADQARLISQITSGMISPASPIRVRFVSPVIQEDKISSTQKNAFRFKPAISGTAVWEDVQTLVFKPDAPLKLRQTYRGDLDLDGILGDPGLETLPVEFTVSGREVAALTYDFAMAGNTPETLVMEGVLDFTIRTSIEDIQRGVKFTLNDRPVDLTWEAEEGGKAFQFRSEPMKRSAEDKNGLITIGETLALSTAYSKSIVLPADAEMRLLEVLKKRDGNRTVLVARFSDILDTRKVLSGLITVEPAVSRRMTPIGRELHISGDFQYGQTYRVVVHRGVRSRWGTVTTKTETSDIAIEDMKPQMRFVSDGLYLPPANRGKLRFQTVNVQRVKLNIKKVFESNLGQFLQTERLSSQKTRSENFDSYYMNRVGVEVVSDTLEIGSERNEWLTAELDMTKLFDEDARGLYLVSLNFDDRDVLFGELDSETEAEWRERRNNYYYGPNYYSDPNSPGYYYQHGRIYKPVILSDIGIIHKKAGKTHYVFTTDIQTGQPLSGVTLTLRTYQSQIAAALKSDNQGKAVFQGIEEDIFFIEAVKGEYRSALKPAEMSWSLTNFDTGGEDAASEGPRVYVYSERGVYRPGDLINLVCIARHKETFPENHPVTLRLRNPKNRLVYEKTIASANDGFFHFPFQSAVDDPTGRWTAMFMVGSSRFYHPVSIETIAPRRLKVELEATPDVMRYNHKQVTLNLKASYLFGAPGAGLDAGLSVSIEHKEKTFKAFPQFVFSHQGLAYQTSYDYIYDGVLDENGNARIVWRLPSAEDVPSSLEARFTGRVLERGGRPNEETLLVPIHPYKTYTGIAAPDEMKTGQPAAFQLITVDAAGDPLSGKNLSYKIYRNRQYWWWEYDSRRDYRLQYKRDASTELVKEGTVNTGQSPVALEFTPETSGDYLLEVGESGRSSHTAGLFIRAYNWGEPQPSDDGADRITLNAEEETLKPGDKAIIRFPSPEQGKVLFTVEHGSQVLLSEWLDVPGDKEEMQIEFPVTAKMVPNIYAAVALIQPHAQSVNDRPLRMYGIIPLTVIDPETRQDIQLSTDPVLRPNKPFTVKLATTDGRPTQFTVAVVDEGLLSLTRFQSPDPWKGFFKKLRLGVLTSDLYNQIIGVDKGEVFKTFSVGGGLAETYREAQLGSEVKRFKPVALFKGPMMTDQNGKAEIQLEMPNYMGAVRIMAASAVRGRYGGADTLIAVKDQLMVLPTLPRVLGPGDKVRIPVTVFVTEPGLRTVTVDMKVEGPLSVTSESRKRLTFDPERAGDQEIVFELQAHEAVGAARVIVEAAAGRQIAFSETDMMVRASSPRIFTHQEHELLPGKTLKMPVPAVGLEGTNHAAISIRRRPKMNFGHRLRWLIRYPYGCLEQTVSSVFPQLYLQSIMKLDEKAQADIDSNINSAIKRLHRFQLASGGFGFWPGAQSASAWGSNYAGHFLIEAREKGYHVPPELTHRWLRYQKSMALNTRDPLLVRVYRVFLLALAGEAQRAPMNLLRENNLRDMTDTERWLLASAYQLAGMERTARNILKDTGTTVDAYRDFGPTYGSKLRDRAIILSQQVRFERWEDARAATEAIAEDLSSSSWYSTQTSAFALMAIGQYLQAIEGDDTPVMKGSIRLPDGEKIPFETTDADVSLEITSGFGKTFHVVLDKASSVNRAYLSVEGDGIPLVSTGADLSQNLILDVEWLDEEGNVLSPSAILQGTAFWGHFRAARPSTGSQALSDLALVQVLPAGWEIQNVRLDESPTPHWMDGYKLYRESYTDIRDDRIMWFFDLNTGERTLDFVVKLNAVTAGEYVLPPAILESMYNNRYKARKAGRTVTVNPAR